MRIALRNIIKHRWTSALMFVIFVLISAALYWTTGIANAVQKIEYHMYRDSDGDATLYLWGNWWGFYEGGKILKALGGLKMENVVLERSAWGSYVDNDRISAQGNVFELTPENRARAKDWYYLSSGRLPEAPGEAAVPEARYRGFIKTGDEIYLSVYTPKDRVLNTLPFKVVGVLKMEPIKGFDSILVTKEDMDSLLDSKDIYNTVTIYDYFRQESLGKPAMENSLNALVSNVYINLHMNNIMTDSHPWCFDIVDFINMNKSFVTIFQGINILAVLLLFPIAGAVIAITIRMLAIKRTAEFATYMALGFRNFKIIRNFVLEVIILAVAGYAAGIFIGAVSAGILQNMRVYLVFQDYMHGPIMLMHTVWDFLYILVFILVLTAVWSVPVIRSIISKAPARVMREQSF